MLTQKEFDKLERKAKDALVQAETQWEPLDEIPHFLKLDERVIEAVAKQAMNCPLCGNNGSVSYSERGVTTGAIRPKSQECGCGAAQFFRIMTESTIPFHDRFIRLTSLKPSEKSQLPTKRQQEVLESIKNDPTQSLAFFGPAGTSKTTFGVALYHHRVTEWIASHRVPSFLWTSKTNWHPLPDTACLEKWKARFPIFRVSAKKLLEDFVQESIHGEDELGKRIRPVVNREIIAKHGSSAAVFIEEIDKVKYSEFKTAALFEIIDACYEHGSQLVFNTNLTPEKFAAQFGEESGPAIARRVGEICTVHNFFEG